VKHWLELGASINACPANSLGENALYSAAKSGHFDVVSYLLEYGADPYICTYRGLNPFLAAASAGHPAICKLLLDTIDTIPYDQDRHSGAADNKYSVPVENLNTESPTVPAASLSHQPFHTTGKSWSDCHGRFSTSSNPAIAGCVAEYDPGSYYRPPSYIPILKVLQTCVVRHSNALDEMVQDRYGQVTEILLGCRDWKWRETSPAFVKAFTMGNLDAVVMILRYHSYQYRTKQLQLLSDDASPSTHCQNEYHQGSGTYDDIASFDFADPSAITYENRHQLMLAYCARSGALGHLARATPDTIFTYQFLYFLEHILKLHTGGSTYLRKQLPGHLSKLLTHSLTTSQSDFVMYSPVFITVMYEYFGCFLPDLTRCSRFIQLSPVAPDGCSVIAAASRAVQNNTPDLMPVVHWPQMIVSTDRRPFLGGLVQHHVPSPPTVTDESESESDHGTDLILPAVCRSFARNKLYDRNVLGIIFSFMHRTQRHRRSTSVRLSVTDVRAVPTAVAVIMSGDQILCTETL
jgi:Ankyrin repeats (3 copies)